MAAVIPFLILIPIGSYYADTAGLAGLFKILAGILVILVTPLYLVLVGMGSNPPSTGDGDVNGDGSVDILDLVTAVNCMNGNCNGREDLNNDGSVDILDLVIVVNNL